MSKLKLYIFGDSICFGQLVSHHNTWISNLSRSLNSENDVLIQNASVNGNTTRMALERMSYDVTSHQPDVLLLQFGMNDCNYWESDFRVPRVSKLAFKANLIEIMERAYSAGTRLILIGTNHPSLKGNFSHYPNLSHSKSNEEYNELIREVYTEIVDQGNRIVLLDNESYWLDQLNKDTGLLLENLLLADGIHLSLMGHSMYNAYTAKIIEREVRSLLI